MPRTRGRSAAVDVARSKRNGTKGQKGSRGKHTGQAPNEAAGRRPRDPDSGDDKSSDVCIFMGTVVIKPQGPERAIEASDRSKSSGEAPQAVTERKGRLSAPRVEDTDSSDDSYDADTDSNASDSSTSFVLRQPDPWDGRDDQLVFDEWKSSVEDWASVNELSRKEVMYYFPRLLSGCAKSCFLLYVARTPSSRKWEIKEVFEALHEHCFPIDYKLRVHRQLVSARQGNLRVVDFATRIRRLAEHVPYPTPKEFLATVFYEGLNGHIKAELTLRGSVPDEVDLETLVKRARNWEARLHRA